MPGTRGEPPRNPGLPILNESGGTPQGQNRGVPKTVPSLNPMITHRLKTLIGTCLAALGTGAGLHLQAAVSVLELERSTDSRTWHKVVLNPGQLTTSGGVLHIAPEAKALYRLRIRNDQNDPSAGFVSALPLDQAPPEAVRIAQQYLRDLLLEDEESEGGDPEGGWIDARLGPVCYPIYDPSHDDGKTPAYLEFKIVQARRPERPEITPDRNAAFDLSPPDTTNDNHDFGHLLVSLTPRDVPVPSFAQSGETPVERLLRTARTDGPIKAFRFDDGLLVAEDVRGEIASSIGNEPFLLDPAILQIAGKEFEGEATERGVRDDGAPKFPAKAYSSYRQFKTEYVQNPFFVELRRLRASQAAVEWNAVLGKEPQAFRVPVGARQQVLATRKVQQAVLAEPGIAVLTMTPGGAGLWITGVKNGGSALEITFQDGDRETFILWVGTAAGQGAALNLTTSGWTAWKYWYAGTWSDQRRYKQFSNDAQMCPGGASGCGPAAWAMLYGWWDRKGAPRLMKSTTQSDAPFSNDDSVRDCNRYIFNQVGPFCVNEQAATMPWNMKLGYKWAEHRGAGRSITWTWGLPYVSPGAVTKVAESIKAGRPAILGLGFYWHYPLAYGYKGRQYKTGSVVWSTQRYFKCNMGWGGSSAQWHNASSTWFGTHARYW